MSAEPEAVVRRWFAEVWNERRLDSIDELFAANAVAYGLAEVGKDDVHGVPAFRRFVQAMLDEFADFRIELLDNFSAGEKVATRWIARGRYHGSSFGPAAGQSVTMTGMSITRVVDGQIVEGWNNWDIMGMAQQLGAGAMVSKVVEKSTPTLA